MFISLLSGLFCCVGFSTVIVFAVWPGACFVFCCLGGGAGPAQTAKKNATAQTEKKKKRTAPSERVVVFAVWAGGWLFFLLVGRGACFFLLFGPGACHLFLLFGRGTGVHSLTGLPGLSSSDPTTKKTQQQQKKHGFSRG